MNPTDNTTPCCPRCLDPFKNPQLQKCASICDCHTTHSEGDWEAEFIRKWLAKYEIHPSKLLDIAKDTHELISKKEAEATAAEKKLWLEGMRCIYCGGDKPVDFSDCCMKCLNEN